MIYLASPSSHPDPMVREMRYLEAVKALAYFIERKEFVFSPIVHSHAAASIYNLEKLNYEVWMWLDHHMIDLSTEVRVLMINGWKESRGVQAEIAYAKKMGKKVTYYNRFGQEMREV